MSTLAMEDLDMETQIRRKNLRAAWRGRWAMSVADWTRMELLCHQEWGATWRDDVERELRDQ